VPSRACHRDPILPDGQLAPPAAAPGKENPRIPTCAPPAAPSTVCPAPPRNPDTTLTSEAVAPAATPARITLDVFEGPLDLLLHLVKVNEMDIHDIEIASITSQYMEFLGAMTALNLEIAGDFLVMAATLLNIKSRSLLPRPPSEDGPVDEEEIDEILSTQELIRRLVEYRKFKDITHGLRELEHANSGVYYRAQVVPVIPGAEQEIPRQDIRGLYEAFVEVLKRVRVEPRHTVYRERFTVDEKMLDIRERLRTHRQINCMRLFDSCVDKEEAICIFLALLEMAKLREITIAQADSFEDILVAAWDESALAAEQPTLDEAFALETPPETEDAPAPDAPTPEEQHPNVG
jgi:segregation and condensation protein A